MTEPKIFKFTAFRTTYDCLIERSKYAANNQISLHLIAADTEHNKLIDVFPGEPIATCTVCLPEYKFEEKETAIKDYSENEGMLQFLVENGIVKDTHKVTYSGYVTIPIVEVLL